MSHIVNLPEPSGPIVYKENLQNSYGGTGCFYVGDNEIECPVEDVAYHTQMLADSLAALEYENSQFIDRLAAKARAAYYGDTSSEIVQWSHVGEDYRARWRSAIRVILDDAP